MNNLILFSPVGGTDPISLSNYKDGSLLHICRVYKPTKIYLYMSQEMLEYHKLDNRYLYCLDKLYELHSIDFECEIIEREKLEEVQKFDYFYEDFRNIIRNIISKMDESDTLLLNISSGTPAMKSALLVLTTLGEFPCKSIQTSTPVRKMNVHNHKGYDVKFLWEANEDNIENFENRCEEVKCPTLSLIKSEEIIKKHVLSYDYAAAIDVIKTLPDDKTRHYNKLLEMAQSRVLLDYYNSINIMKDFDFDFFPIKSSNEIKYFEYALNLDLKRKKEQYADFIRAITPIIVDLFELILKKKCNINLDHYTYDSDENINIDFEEARILGIDLKKYVYSKARIKRWDVIKLKGTDIGNVLFKKWNNFKGPVLSIHLSELIKKFSQDIELHKTVVSLRTVEQRIRNLAAHEIVSVTEDTIKSLTNFSSKEIMDAIKKAFNYTNIKVENKFWNSYDEMNKKIIEIIG